MRLSGILLILLSFVLSGVIYISISQNIAVKYDEILMITIAAYTFFKNNHGNCKSRKTTQESFSFACSYTEHLCRGCRAHFNLTAFHACFFLEP